MKITFIGLSCFLIENDQGDKLLIDPYNDSPEFYLGLRFPTDIKADLFLVSHPDEDHSYLKSEWIHKRRASNEHDTSDGVSLFPHLDLKGTLVKEWNGDLNIAWSFTIDGIRFLHLADNSHLLVEDQLKEIGPVDIVFISPPKREGTFHLENIKLLHPKIVIPSHYIPPSDLSENASRNEVEAYIEKKVLQSWVKNLAANEKSAHTLADMFYFALDMKREYPQSKDILSNVLIINKEDLTDNIKVYVFRKCLGQ